MGANKVERRKEKERVGKVSTEDVTFELSLEGACQGTRRKYSRKKEKKKCEKTQSKERT